MYVMQLELNFEKNESSNFVPISFQICYLKITISPLAYLVSPSIKWS